MLAAIAAAETLRAGPMKRRPRRRAACLAGAGLALYAATRIWSVAVTTRPGLPDLRSTRTGAAAQPWLIALALVALAGTGALLATRGVLRRGLGGLLVAGRGGRGGRGAITARAGLAGRGVDRRAGRLRAGRRADRRGAAWVRRGTVIAGRPWEPVRTTSSPVPRRPAGRAVRAVRGRRAVRRWPPITVTSGTRWTGATTPPPGETPRRVSPVVR